MEASVDPALALAVNVASPLLVAIENPLRKPLLVLIEREIPMLGLLLYEFSAAESRLRVDEFIRAEGGTALLALVSICTFSAATWTCSCNISVCKECLCFLVIVLLTHLLNELALIIQLAEILRCILVMSL